MYSDASVKSRFRGLALPISARAPAYPLPLDGGGPIVFGTQCAGGPFLSFPPGGGRAALNEAALRRRRRGEQGAVKLAPLRRRSRGERLGWGEEPMREAPPPLTPTLAIPVEGEGTLECCGSTVCAGQYWGK